MNGVHDMGGLQSMGPVPYERNEPVFHAAWEGRIQAMYFAMNASRVWNLDAARHQRNLIPAAEYLRNSYYENTFAQVLALLLKYGLATRDEIASGTPAPGAAKAVPALRPEAVLPLLARGTVASRDAQLQPHFKIGQRVRARNVNPTGHTRLPRYARGKCGAVELDNGVFVFPDSNAQSQGEKPQHVYAVRFAARELWGEQAAPNDAVYVDLWDDYLEPA